MSFLKKLFGRKDKPGGQMQDNEIRDLVIRTLRTHAPNAIVAPNPNDDVSILYKLDSEGESEMNITNLANNLRVYPDLDKNTEIEKFVRTMVAAQQADGDLNRDNVFVVLRPDEYVNHINSLNKDGTDLPSKPFLGELQSVYMEDNPDAMRTVSYEEFEDQSLDDIHELAVNNLRPWLSKLVGQEAENLFCMYTIEDNGYLISGMVHIKGYWDFLEDRHGKKFLFAIPRKDQFFVFNFDHPNAISVASDMIQATWDDNFNLLSPQIYVRSDGKNEVFKAS